MKKITIEVNEDIIDYKWESLFYSENEEIFAKVKDGNYHMDLVTYGSVRIINHTDGSVYKNGQLPEEFLDALRNDENGLYDSYEMDMQNWFALDLYEGEKFIDTCVFEDVPTNIQELQKSLLDYFIAMSEEI